MNFLLRISLAAIAISSSFAGAQEIDNPAFEKGKSGWLGAGKAVYINSANEASDTPKPDFVPCLRVELNRNSWQEIKQTLRAKPSETEIHYSIQVMASSDFAPLAESRDYTKDIDFSEGGHWVWSALVYPKCDFLIRVQDSGWQYRPLSLQPLGTWKTFTVDFTKLKSSKRELALLLPPGTGVVYLKGD